MGTPMPHLSNPWRDILEADYVGHMESPSVGQRAVLNQVLARAFGEIRPRTVLVLGGSNGNGLEHADPAVTTRLVVVDINHQFLAALRAQTFPAASAIDAREADVEVCALESGAFDLVHAALLLEYVEWRQLVPRVAATLTPGGVFSVVLQRRSPSTPAVTPTRFTSLGALERVFSFVDPDELVERCAAEKLTIADRRQQTLPGDKMFEIMRFTRMTPRE